MTKVLSGVFLLLQALKAAPWCPLSTLWRHCTTRCPWSRWTTSSTGCVRAAAKLTPKPWRVRLVPRSTPALQSQINQCDVSLQSCPASLTPRVSRLSTVLSVLCPPPGLRRPCSRPVRTCGVSVESIRTEADYRQSTLKTVIRLIGNLIISALACFNLMGCCDFVFQMAVSPPVPCPALALPPLSRRAPPSTSPSTIKQKHREFWVISWETWGGKCAFHPHTHDLLTCVLSKCWEKLLVSLASGAKPRLHPNLPTILCTDAR